MAAQRVEESAGEKVNVNLDELIDYINLLLNRREKADQEKTRPHKKPFKWPGGSDWKALNEILSSAIEFTSGWKDVTSGTVKAILKKIGNASLATAGLLVVAECLERFDDISNNDKECLDHLKEMTKVANLVKALPANTKGNWESVIIDATAMIVEGAIICCAQLDSSKLKRFLAASKSKEDLSKIKQDLVFLYNEIGAHASVSAIERIERLEHLLAKNFIELHEHLSAAINHTQFNLQPEESCAQPATGAPQCVKESVGENVDGVPHCVEESAGENVDGVPNCVQESAGENVDGIPNCVQESAMAMRRLCCCIPFMRRLCCCIPFLEDKDGEDSADDLDNLDNLVKHISDLDITADDFRDNLVKYISDLLSLRKQVHQKKPPHKKFWTWPNGSDWKILNEMLSSGIDFVSDLKDYISGPVKSILKAIGNASLATAGLLVVAYTLERFDDISSNNEQCFELLKEMSNVANLVKILRENPKEMENEIEDAIAMIVKGAIICFGQMDSSPWNRFLKAPANKEVLSDITGELNTLYCKIAANEAAELKRKPPLSRKYPTHAVGIENSITEVLDLLECKSEENVVTVILHGFGGTGKSTLADAVFSKIEGYEYSKVELGSYPDIVKLQKAIIKDLMEPEALIPNFRSYEDGQRELGEILKNVQAFIYIDNVLDGDELKKLLPPYLDTANRVRFLLTARDENVKFKCPRSGTKAKIYPMKYIEPPQAKLILEKEIREGPEGLNPSQFNDIIQICGGIPLMLTLAAPFIGRAVDKQKAYHTLKRHAGKLAVAHEGNPSSGNESESESGPSSPKASPMASGEEE